ncbi:hypothetical protein HAX54_046777 [Datura stramonium]|uniref:Uncharacterized protein n=1 Tax=Datura stramonium TaxID=4076 RepID=A0ABS8WJF3_DATST|nr:hypothetical protein [Datura stramonium]
MIRTPAMILHSLLKIKKRNALWVYCLHPSAEGKSSDGTVLNGQGFNNCEFETLQCLGNQTSGLEEIPGCAVGNSTPTVTLLVEAREKEAHVQQQQVDELLGDYLGCENKSIVDNGDPYLDNQILAHSD